MATNKHALIRFQTLDKCFRNPGRKYFMDDLVDECAIVLKENYGIDSSISSRQIYSDIKDMESRYEFELVRKKVGQKTYYRYIDTKFSINNKPLTNQEESEMREALVTISRIKGLPHFEWIEEMITRLDAGLNTSSKENPIIQFDQNVDVAGLVHMQDIYHAISRRQSICITYQSFKMPTSKDFIFSPYFLKQFKGRWYTFGYEEQTLLLHNFALDRMLMLSESNAAYIESDVNFEDYFDDVIGVTKGNAPETLDIKIRVDASYYPYIATEPLHGSQKVLSKTEEKVILQIQVVINYELQSLLLSYGELIEVLEPLSLREGLANRVSKLHHLYQKENADVII